MDKDSAALWRRLERAAAAGGGLSQSLPESTESSSTVYILGPDLAAAAEIALRLRRPLLLTGDPGAGKTEFAVALAAHLRIPLLSCNIRSTTTVGDLFYTVDDVARFRDAQAKDRTLLPMQYYLSFNGLGRAILFAGGPSALLLPSRDRLLPDDGTQAPAAPPPTRFDQLYPKQGFPFPSGGRVVVLLDEFDKAPRDTPNDMLNEFEQMRFDIPELGVVVAAPAEMKPIIVVTSNSERSLPEPFLRRCIYYDLPFPADPEKLRLIVAQHLPSFSGSSSRLLQESLAIFNLLRQQPLSRSPGTAELLDWLSALITPPADFPSSASLRAAWASDADVVRHTLNALLKAKEDFERAETVLRAEYGPPGKPG